jgi:hypothetical protein
MEKLRAEIVSACEADPVWCRNKLRGMRYLQSILKESETASPIHQHGIVTNGHAQHSDFILPFQSISVQRQEIPYSLSVGDLTASRQLPF